MLEIDKNKVIDAGSVSEAMSSLTSAKKNSADTMRVLEGTDILSGIIRVEGGEAEKYLKGQEGEIRELLREVEKMDKDSVERAFKDGKLATSIRNFLETGAPLGERERKIVAGILERRVWGHIFNDLKEGDIVLSVLMPGAEFLTIKYLNDKLLGETETNKIIKRKREILQSKLGDKIKDVSFLVSTYKTEIVKISAGSDMSNIDLESVMQEVDVVMSEFIENDVINPLIDKYKKEGNESKRIELESFLGKLKGLSGADAGGKHAFRMNYGFAVVKNKKSPKEKEYEADNYEGKITALSQSLQTSEMSRVSNDKYGEAYDESKIIGEIIGIESLRTQIFDSGNTIKDSRGNEVKVFSKVKYDGSEFFVFNKNLLTKIRSESFLVFDSEEDKIIMDQIIAYIKKLNIFDMIKPFRDEDRNTVIAEAKRAKDLAEKIENGEALSDDEKKEGKRMLFADERAKKFTSRMEFSRRAMAMKKASYISLDVKGLGADLRLEFERLSQICIREKDPTARKELIEKMCLSAGDKTTVDKLVVFWDAVYEVLGKNDLIGQDDLATALVGGDELMLAVEIGDGKGKISEEKLGELLFAFKNTTNARVVESRVVASTKDVDESVNDENVLAEEHILAKKKTETCSAILKGIENVASKLSDLVKEKDGAQEAREILSDLGDFAGVLFVSTEEGLKANAVVSTNKDNKADFDVFYDSSNRFSYSKIKRFMDKFLGKEVDK